jgi:hypothetical protein
MILMTTSTTHLQGPAIQRLSTLQRLLMIQFHPCDRCHYGNYHSATAISPLTMMMMRKKKTPPSSSSSPPQPRWVVEKKLQKMEVMKDAGSTFEVSPFHIFVKDLKRVVCTYLAKKNFSIHQTTVTSALLTCSLSTRCARLTLLIPQTQF